MTTDDLSPELGTVLSLDNVPVELPLARVGSRVLAGVVDYFLLFLVVLLWSAGMITLSSGLGLRPGWGIGFWILGAFALEYGYFAVQEIVFDGRTVGKRVFGLRVVARDGAAAGNGALLVRNLVRSIDLLFGVMLMALDPLARRLGDRLAGTLVVHQRQPLEELVVARLPAGWSAAETQLVESYLRRARELEPAARLELGRRLERLVDERAPGFLPGAPGPDPLPRLWNGFRQERG
jgi:uncharacterized RDD family membrane protein YckC